MDCTDTYDRSFLRCVTRHTLLYSEMIVADAILHGPRKRLLEIDETEHPVALQVGGSEPHKLADVSRIAEDAGFDEINLNVGCPSSRVGAGRFGVCLMAWPDIVARCVEAMQHSATIPVTVKCRIGIDDMDENETLPAFVEEVANAGCRTFVVHARKAWLHGLSPKQNREIPPLRYGVVYETKRRFPHLAIVINGGIRNLDEARGHLAHVDGAMIGRAAYHTPYTLADADRVMFGAETPRPKRKDIVEAWYPYLERKLAAGVPLKRMTRHILGLYHGEPGARSWRRTLVEEAAKSGAGIEVIENALRFVEQSDACGSRSMSHRHETHVDTSDE